MNYHKLIQINVLCFVNILAKNIVNISLILLTFPSEVLKKLSDKKREKLYNKFQNCLTHIVYFLRKIVVYKIIILYSPQTPI